MYIYIAIIVSVIKVIFEVLCLGQGNRCNVINVSPAEF